MDVWMWSMLLAPSRNTFSLLRCAVPLNARLPTLVEPAKVTCRLKMKKTRVSLKQKRSPCLMPFPAVAFPFLIIMPFLGMRGPPKPWHLSLFSPETVRGCRQVTRRHVFPWRLPSQHPAVALEKQLYIAPENSWDWDGTLSRPPELLINSYQFGSELWIVYELQVVAAEMRVLKFQFMQVLHVWESVCFDCGHPYKTKRTKCNHFILVLQGKLKERTQLKARIKLQF